MINKEKLAIKKLFIVGFPFMLAFYMFLMGHVLAAAVYIASIFLFSALSAYNLSDENLSKISFLSPQDKKQLQSSHQTWPKKLGIGLGWLVAAGLYYGRSLI